MEAEAKAKADLRLFGNRRTRFEDLLFQAGRNTPPVLQMLVHMAEEAHQLRNDMAGVGEMDIDEIERARIRQRYYKDYTDVLKMMSQQSMHVEKQQIARFNAITDMLHKIAELEIKRGALQKIPDDLTPAERIRRLTGSAG